MKTFITATGLALLLLLPAQLTAQNQPKDAETDSGSDVQNLANSDREIRIPEINFDNIPLSDAVQILGQEFPEINFVTSGEVGDFIINLHLRSVTLKEILKAIEITASGQVRANQTEDRLVAFYGRRPPEKPKPVLRAYNLKQYLASRVDTESEEEVNRALENLYDVLNTSWDMLQKAEPNNEDFVRPQLRIHPQTQLLIAVGNPEALQVIDQVVGELSRQESKPSQPSQFITPGGFGGGSGGGGFGGGGFNPLPPGNRN